MPDIELDLELDETTMAPTASVERTEDGATITCTDVYGTTTATVYDGEKGDPGTSAGFGTPTATIDGGVGTPSVEVTASGSDTAKVFAFAFHNLKGEQGETGETGATGAAAGFGTPTASVDANVGTPSVTVTASGQDTAKVFDFAFHNLKGDKGDTGDPAAPGSIGTTELADGAVTQAKLADSLESALAFSFGAYPDLASGNVTGEAVDESYLFHASSDAKGSVAEIQSIKGRTLVWNQLWTEKTVSYTGTGYTIASTGDGKWTLTVTQTTSSDAGNVSSLSSTVFTAGHKYLIFNDSSSIAVGLKSYSVNSNAIFTASSAQYNNVTVVFSNLAAGTYTFHPQLFDLTAMFGAGNEPSTVAEFEALYPASYYAYNAGSLLSVNMQGIETVGFNQYSGTIVNGKAWGTADGTEISAARYAHTAKIRALPNVTYNVKATYRIAGRPQSAAYYDASGAYLGNSPMTAGVTTFTTKPGTAEIGLNFITDVSGTSFSSGDITDVCINISGARNGEYEPYWTSQLSIPAATHFPNGMRSAGTVCDELQSDKAVTRIGAVDLGTLTWERGSTSVADEYRFTTQSLKDVIKPSSDSAIGNILCAKYESKTANNTFTQKVGVSVGSLGIVQIFDTAYKTSTVDTFTAAMSGVWLFYELATPTTQAIEPPLSLVYRVDESGTERILVDTTQHAPQSAPPTIATEYAYDMAHLRDAALSTVAPIENGKASTNYAIGAYLVHGGVLYKVTSAIASGEAINPGTNATATTVMAELVALTS